VVPNPHVVVPAVTIAIPAVALLLAGPVVAACALGGIGATLVRLRRTAPSRRAAAADRELPIVLESVARRLRSGASLAQAVTEARPDAGCFLRASWEDFSRRARVHGVAVAADGWAAAVSQNSPDRPAVRLAAAALALAAETGGAPARAVDGVAATLRSRAAVESELRALTSQAKASAAVIALSPLAFAAFSGVTDPRIAAFARTSAGTILVLAGLGLDGLGAWWMARLCRSVQ
jgi:tight adherence protein B